MPHARVRTATLFLAGGLGLAALVAGGCGTTTAAEGGPTASAVPGSTAAVTTAVPATAPAYGPGRHEISLDVDGTPRTATVVVPRDLDGPAPLVFMFHGHGGSGDKVDKRLDLDGEWPEAIVVYPDGLVGHKGKTDPEGTKPGWQTTVGEDGDRDLRFYDALKAQITGTLPVDHDRIYLAGHSNGSAFTSLLLNQRGNDIAAVATMSAQPPPGLLATDPERSMFMMMGEQDPVVAFANQQAAIPRVEAKLGADPTRATVDGYLRTEPARDGHELAVYIHPGGHDVPDAVPPLLVDFFQRHTLSGG